VANVPRQLTELKTESNESCGLVLRVCLDEVGMVEEVYATIVKKPLAPLRAAILGERHKPDVSKSIRRGPNRVSSICKSKGVCLLSVSEGMAEFG
jgi:hypothetical protein